MQKIKPFHRRKEVVIFSGIVLAMILLGIRLFYLMMVDSDYYSKRASDIHEREREIRAARGKILDRNGTILADNRAVCTISVIHSQIKDQERVIEILVKELGLSEKNVRKKVEKNSSIERIQKNVEKEIGDRIRKYKLDGVKVDEDYRRNYPYGTLASKVLGFTGGDNQGIIGLEAEYDSVLFGTSGKILTLADARGIELKDGGEYRQEAVEGNDLIISLDYNIQKYVQQAAEKTLIQKEADSVSILVMNPQNGEIYAMTNVPEFDLNHPYQILSSEIENFQTDKMQRLNQIWRNGCINDTYEPGSTFKIVTAAAALEEKVVSLNDVFTCPGYKIVEDRRIRCAKYGGHGTETFVEGTQNSCNPVFIEVGLRLGTERYFSYFHQFMLDRKTGIDLPGEASTIMHKQENVGQVELATISFGQSFQITPIQLAATVSSIINGGRRITPHLAMKVCASDETLLKVYNYPSQEQIVTEETSETIRYLLEQVVDGGGGKNASIEGYRIGGKTATSETLPRSAHQYISSFLGFAPADEPQVLAVCLISHPQGLYYGGTIAAPVVREIFENILPYLEVKKGQ